jgi:pheromone shutdown protein TraB
MSDDPAAPAAPAALDLAASSGAPPAEAAAEAAVEAALGAAVLATADAAFAPAAEALPASVTELTHEGVRYFLIGTAHVSAHSVDEVRSVIARLQPDVVAVELCKPRYRALVQEGAFRNLDIFKVIREGRTLYLLAHLALAAYQRRMGAALGVKPGAELLAAVEAGRAAGARVELIDREINTTLKRTWANIGLWKRSMMLSSMIVGGDDGDAAPVTAESIEKLKDQKALSTMLEDLAQAFPEVKGPLIDERDRYMASKMIEVAQGATDTALPAEPVAEGGVVPSDGSTADQATDQATEKAAAPPGARAPARPGPARSVVAVVGAAHVPGMRAIFGKPVDRKALEALPRPAWWWTALKWAIPALLVVGLVWGLRGDNVEGFLKGGQGTHSVLEVLMAWIAPTSIGAGLLTLLAGGSLLTVATAIVVAPIAAIHPLLGTAMVTGVVEAWRRKPSVADCEALAEDTQSLRGFWRNPVTRTLLIAIASGIGTAVGMWIGVGYVVKMLT